MLRASCHCQAVHLDVPFKPKSLTSCNCSICRRYQVLWGYFTQAEVKVMAKPDDLVAYVWGDRQLEFLHCKTCGCCTHYEAVEKADEARLAVNARMMDPEDIKDIRVRHFYGAVSWTYLNE